MNHETSWSGTRKRFVEGRIVGCELRCLRNQMVNRNSVQTQIINQHVAIVSSHGGAMGVRSGLALRVGTVAGVLERGNGFAEGAVF